MEGPYHVVAIRFDLVIVATGAVIAMIGGALGFFALLVHFFAAYRRASMERWSRRLAVVGVGIVVLGLVTSLIGGVVRLLNP